MQTAILTFIIPVISMIFTCAFLALWWNDRKQKPVLAFAVSFGALSLGIVINIWIIERADPVGIVAYHLISMMGLLALMWGIAKRAEVKAPLVFCAITAVFVAVVLGYTTSIGETDAMRLAQNTNSAMITALIATTLWYGTKRNPADHALVWVLVTLSAFGFIRPVLTIVAAGLAGEDGAGLIILSAIHVLVIASLLTLIALCLIASIVLGTMHSERAQAAIDPLTGLPNRAAFEDSVDDLLQKAGREGVPLALLVGDIDNFKRVNDTWGHSAGDAVISAFGALIEKKIRAKDLAGRIGGEEFCIVIWNCSEASAVSLANRLRLAFSNALIPGFASDQRFTVSFGIAHVQPGEGYLKSFARADQALYSAKRAGRNRVEAASSASIPNGRQEERQPTDEGPGVAPFGEVVSFGKVKAGQNRS